MKRTRLNALQRHFASAALLVTVMLVPLSWPVVVTKENKTYPTLSGRVSDMRFVEEASNDGGQLLQ